MVPFHLESLYQPRVHKLVRADSQTDLDSVRTEDMEREFSKSLVLPPGFNAQYGRTYIDCYTFSILQTS